MILRSILTSLSSSMLLLAVLPAAGADTEWPRFRGPRGDGISLERGLPGGWPEDGPAVLWRRELGEGYSAISAVGDRLYTMFANGKDEYVVCLAAADGAEIWRRRVDAKWLDRFGNGPRATPTVSDGTVYALSARGKLVALDAADGSVRFKRDLHEEYGAEAPQWGVAASPIVEGDRLLVAVGGGDGRQIVAFDKTDGTELWRAQSGSAGYAAPLAIQAAGRRQVLFFTARELVAVDPADGEALWRLPWKTSYDVNAASPVFVAPDRVFVSSGYDKGAAMLRLRSADGDVEIEELWRSREMKNQFSSSVHVEGFLYGFDDKTLKCVDAKTGETRWRQRGFGHGSLLWADGKLIVLGDRGQLVLAQATPEGYRELARAQPFTGKTWTVPTLHRGRLYLRDEKEIMALEFGAKPSGEKR